jgi:hypothetical protein
LSPLAAVRLALLLLAVSPPPAEAQRQFSLEANVRLLGASRNNTRYLATIAPATDPVVPLAFRIDILPEEAGKAELQLTPFDSEGAPPISFTLMEFTTDGPGIEGRPLDVQLHPATMTVMRNPDYRSWGSFQSVELAVTALAALFAIATGLGYGYNATSGTSSHYIGLFLWAAGASAGGNLFKQRGDERTVGGVATQLPSR